MSFHQMLQMICVPPAVVHFNPNYIAFANTLAMSVKNLPKKYELHCCMKCPQILREKTLSQKFAVIALRIQWKLFTEGNAFKKCQQIILPLIIINAIIFRGQNLS